MSSLSCHLGDSPFSASTWGIFSCGIRTQLRHVESSSLTRDGTRTPAFGQQNLSQWTTFTYWILFLLLLLLINDLCIIAGNMVYSVHYCVPSTWFTVGSFLKKKIYLFIFGCAGSSLLLVVVQLFSCVLLFETAWTAALQASLSFTISQNLFKLMSIEMVMLSNRLILCWTLLILPSIFPSIRVFSNELALWIRCQTSASASVLPMNIQDWFPLGLTGLISLRPKGV